MTTLKNTIKLLTAMFLLGLSVACILAVLVSIATTIYTSYKTPYRAYKEPTEPIVSTLTAVNDTPKQLLPVTTAGAAALTVTNNQAMQPFGKTNEDELTPTQYLEPTDLRLQVTRHYNFLQPSDYNGALYYNTATKQIESYRSN